MRKQNSTNLNNKIGNIKFILFVKHFHKNTTNNNGLPPQINTGTYFCLGLYLNSKELYIAYTQCHYHEQKHRVSCCASFTDNILLHSSDTFKICSNLKSPDAVCLLKNMTGGQIKTKSYKVLRSLIYTTVYIGK